MERTGGPGRAGDRGGTLSTDAGALRQLGRGSLLNLLGAGVTTLCTLGVAVATTRALSTTQAGLVFTLTSGLLIAATLLRLGAPTALVLFLARQDDPDGARTRAFTRAALRLITPLALGGAVIGAGAAGLAHRLAPDSVLGTAPALLTALAVLLPFAVLAETLLAVSRGHHDMGPTVRIERIGRPAGQLLLSVAAWLWWPTVLGLGLAWALPYLPAFVAAVRATPLLRHAGPVATITPPEAAEFRGLLWSRSLVSLSQILFARLDIILVAALTAPAQAAIYTAATRFVVVAQLVQTSIGTAVEPGMARAAGTGDLRQLRTLYATGTTWLVMLAWPLLLVCAVSAPWWLGVFGPAYREGAQVVVVLTAAMMLSTGIGTVESLLNMAGRARSLVFYNLGGLILMVGLDLLLIPRHGALGAAIGWAATIAFKNVAPLVETWWRLRLHPFSPAWLGAAAVAVVSGGVLPALGRDVGGGRGVALGLLAGVVLWAAVAAWAFREHRRPGGRHGPARRVRA